MNQGERIEKGIVLRAINYQESDKILTIFTADEGKIVAKLKSCRQPKAKLKMERIEKYADNRLRRW